MKLINKNNNTIASMGKRVLITMVFIALSFTTFAQVGIGTTTPNAAASALEVKSTNKGLLVPRVANTGVIVAPVNGLIVYDISAKCVKAFQKGAWSNCLVKPAPLTIAAIVAMATNPAADGTPSLADLVAVGVKGATGSQVAYEEAIADEQPTTLAILQAVIDAN